MCHCGYTIPGPMCSWARGTPAVIIVPAIAACRSSVRPTERQRRTPSAARPIRNM